MSHLDEHQLDKYSNDKRAAQPTPRRRASDRLGSYFDVTAIGEGQLRFSVPAGKRLEQASQFDVNVSGTEGNVTGLLSRLGWLCGLVTGLPNSPLGQRVKNEYQLTGLDLSAVHWSDCHRLATYYVEYAVPPRATQVYYDRADTCFTNLTVDDIAWSYLLDTRLLHLSGLTLALSPSVRTIFLEAIDRAKAADIPVSFDMNYRSKLWTPKEAAEAVKPIFNEVDILFCGRRDAQLMFGLDGPPQTVIDGLRELSNARYIVTTLSHEGLIAWDGDYHCVPAKNVTILDRIGAGDAMVAGVLHGYLQDDFLKGLNYGVTCAAMALSQYGDQVVTHKNELETLLSASPLDIER
jgi:2-dehydro-3-deoxygluconokinase